MQWPLASVAFLAAATSLAQTASPKFPSAVIRISEEADGASRYFTDREKLTLQNQTLRDCVRIAFDVKAARASAGAAKWIETQRFDIDAQAASVPNDHEMKAMLRTLLLERFRLELHRETKLSPGYALVVAKGGLKLRAVEAGPSRISTRRASLTGENASMPGLAQALSDVMNMPVMI